MSSFEPYTLHRVVLKPSISMSIIMYLSLGSVHTWCTFMDWPFRTKTHTPLELLVPCAKYMVPGHSDRHNGSVSIVVCVPCKSIILQSFIFSHSNIFNLLYLSPSPFSQKIYRSSEENRSKWVLFRIAIYRSSVYNPIFCAAVSAELPGVLMFWNSVPGHKVSRRACVQIPMYWGL